MLAVLLQSRTLSQTPQTVTKEQPKVEEYIKKELVTTTKVTIEDPPRRFVVSYKPPQARVSDNVEVIGTSFEQCVEFYKRVTGRHRSLGYAGNIPSQGGVPQIGAGALWRGYGHIGVVVSINEDTITVEDANWTKGKVTRHSLPVSAFRGFIYE